MIRVRSVHIYPIKATAPIDVAAAEVELHGLRDDRRWAVIDADGRRLSATRHDILMRVTATPDADGSLTLTATGHPTTHVALPRGGKRIDVDISRFPSAVDAGEAAAAFFTHLLGQRARLVWQDDPGRRSISERHGGVGGEPLNLADTGPLLLTSVASLAQLDDWIAQDHEPQAIAMQRFRPNVVVEGDLEPFAEDHWRRLRIGGVSYRFAECCDRCMVTTVDPVTLVHGKEPIRTLARHRRWDRKTWFGIRIVPLSTGTLAVGDEVDPA